MNTKETGDFGETEVCKTLISRGYKILERNFRSRLGEIDIIAKDGDCIVFIEVKTRKNNVFGNASEYVTYSKQKKIIKTAKYYLKGMLDVEIRFDVAEVYYQKINDTLKVTNINYIKNAFMGQ